MVKTTKKHIVILDLKIEKKLVANKYSEIARHAGLHPSTVWRVLNNQRKNINTVIKVKNAIYQIFHNKVTFISEDTNDINRKTLKINSKLSGQVKSILKNSKIN